MILKKKIRVDFHIYLGKSSQTNGNKEETIHNKITKPGKKIFYNKVLLDAWLRTYSVNEASTEENY